MFSMLVRAYTCPFLRTHIQSRIYICPIYSCFLYYKTILPRLKELAEYSTPEKALNCTQEGPITLRPQTGNSPHPAPSSSYRLGCCTLYGACMRYTLEMSTPRSRLSVCSSDCPHRPAQTCAGQSAKGILNDLSDLSVAFACVWVCQRACIVCNSISAASACACA